MPRPVAVSDPRVVPYKRVIPSAPSVTSALASLQGKGYLRPLHPAECEHMARASLQESWCVKAAVGPTSQIAM
jgi:hypothetical protein